MRRSRGALVVIAAGAALGLAIGCELIVPGDVPSFTCGSEGAAACPTGLVCDLATGTCIAPGSGGDDGPGDDGPAGDGDARRDAAEASGPLELGQPCRFDGDCRSHLCGTSTILTTTFTQGAGPICTSTCCTSADCPLTFVCFNGGTGGSYCVPASKAQRTPALAGGAKPGATCGGATDCRSGLCTGSRCVDTCCLQTDCTSGTICAVGSVSVPSPPHDEWICVPQVGVRNAGTNCTDNTNCKNNNCVNINNPTTCPNCPVCTPSCCSSNDCATWAGAAPTPNGATCAYGLSGSDQLKWCFPVDTTRAPTGSTCGSSFDCRSMYCDPELRKCLEVCCQDADCAPGNVCRPSAVNTPFLRCVPGPR